MASHYPERFADGDVIIRNTIGWPSQHRWWEVLTDKQKALVHWKNLHILAQVGSTLGDKIVLFNGRYFPDCGVFAIVIPPFEDMMRNVKAKRDRGVTSQPVTEKEILGNAEYLRKVAATQGIRLFDSFDDAYNFWKAYY